MLADDPQTEAYFDRDDEDDADPRARDDEVPPPPGASVAFVLIDTEEQAAELVDRINIEQERVARIKASCAAMVATAKGRLQRVQDRYAETLKRWAAGQVEGKQTKTVRLPTGSLSFRTIAAAWEVKDEAAALAWAKEHQPSAVKVTETVLKTEIYEHIAKTGEVPDGVVETEARESFNIKGAK
jgi:phage host-nuclease inhibitor protein Gam